MPFTPAFDGVTKAIRKALEPTWSVVRSDELVSPPALTDRILLWILASDLVIADITDQRPNVMYELGMARGYGRRAIIISQHKKLPFDLATTEQSSTSAATSRTSRSSSVSRAGAVSAQGTRGRPVVRRDAQRSRDPRIMKRSPRSLAGS